MSSSSTFFNEILLVEYVQKVANASNEKLAEKVEELTALLNKKTQCEAELSNMLNIRLNDLDYLQATFTGLQKSHDALVLSINKELSALQSARR